MSAGINRKRERGQDAIYSAQTYPGLERQGEAGSGPEKGRF